MVWVGLDLHKRYITACALEDGGLVVAEHRRLPADVGPLVAWLQALGDAVTVAMEATLYWAWLHDQLSAAGIAALAAHPYQVKLIWQARCKTDPIDARKLADLLRTSLLPAIWVPDAEVRARRKLLRGRAYLVRLRTSLKNRIPGTSRPRTARRRRRISTGGRDGPGSERWTSPRWAVSKSTCCSR